MVNVFPSDKAAPRSVVPFPGRSGPLSTATLPAPPTPLVGREREVQRVCALLRRDGVQLVTLTGPGGVGKTRLAVQVMAALAADFADGVVFVPLASIADPDLVLLAISQALGVRERGEGSLHDGLLAVLDKRRLLLVLDNFEHLLAAAPLVSGLLRVSPQMKVLATSRARLRLSDEHEFPVPPLALPDPAHLPPVEELADVAAVRLFAERVEAVRPDFALTETNADAIAAICHRLDGLPLAIELAAARSKVLSPGAMLTRLERRLPLLAGGPRDLPARQQTMRDAIAWSYDLLDPDEQALFRRLSVFVGGFTLEAAEAVIDASAEPDLEVLGGTASLVDHSLLLRVDRPDGATRLTMLETVREFGLEQLAAAGEVESARRSHAGWCLGLAERIELAQVAPGQASSLDRLEAERDNLRAALAWLEEAGESELGLRLAGALGMFWDILGPVSEGLDWLERALARAGPTPIAARAKALAWAGLLVRAQGDHARAMQLEEQALAVARKTGDPRVIADALHSLGQAAVSQGDYDRATAAYEEALGLYRGLGGDLAAFALVNLGIASAQRDDSARARPLFEEGLAEHRARGNTWGAGFALRALGELAHAQGDDARAVAHFRECAALWWEHGYRRGIGYALMGLAAVAGAAGEPTRAARLFGAAESVRETHGLALWATEQAASERTVAAARVALGEENFAVAYAAGRALSLDEAVAEALAGTLPEEPATGEKPDEVPALAALSAREIDVLRLLAAGHSNQVIADALYISPSTVKVHITHILAKLSVDSRLAAATYAHRLGLQ